MQATTTNDRLSPFLATSVVLHALLVLIVMFGPSLFPEQETIMWGTSNDPNIRVGVTSTMPGIPLPSPPSVQETAKGYTDKSLNPPEPAPKSEPKTPEAEIKVPSPTAKPEKKPDPAPPRVARNEPPSAEPAPAVSNAIPGRAGQMPLPFGRPGAGTGQATFGDQTFGTRFPQYVNAMHNAIRAVWQDTIAVPRGATPRVYVTFTIDRRGKVSDLEIAKSSGSVQLDNSANRAVRAATLPPLPPDYTGASVDVEFIFEYTR
jgi:TonB family protein